jgi:hypothetical protein
MQPQKNQRARAAPKENRNTHREGTEQTEFGSIFSINYFLCALSGSVVKHPIAALVAWIKGTVLRDDSARNRRRMEAVAA